MAQKIGFIGTGNMGSALARAAAKSIPGASILLCNRTPAKSEALAAELGAQAADAQAVCTEASYIFLGVKPDALGPLLESLRPALLFRETPFVLVSMAAGVTTRQVRKLAGADWPVIRIMPNTPCAIGEGVILYAGSEGTDDAALDVFAALMAGAGRLIALPEALFDAGSALSGCGPAFADLFLEALADGGVACGLPRATALLLAAQTLAGSARLLLETGTHPGALKDAVCSPGGSTIQGVYALERGGLRGAVMEAVVAACEKTKALGQAGD